MMEIEFTTKQGWYRPIAKVVRKVNMGYSYLGKSVHPGEIVGKRITGYWYKKDGTLVLELDTMFEN